MAKRASRQATKRRKSSVKKRKPTASRHKVSSKKRPVRRSSKTATPPPEPPHLSRNGSSPTPVMPQTNSSSLPAPTPAGGAIRVRMYRQGLGDCFLVTLPKQDGSSFHLMIDCGVILGTDNASDMMTKVVANIIDETHGYVDMLVVTHEHWDHVSGFIQAGSLFDPSGKKPSPTDNPKKLAVGEVWFAWTEDPSDALATQLRKDRAKRVQKLAAFVSTAAANPAFAQANEMVDGVNEILSFFGVNAKTGESNSTPAALAFARALSQKLRYCRPSDPPVTLAGVSGIRIYVLGPPHDKTALHKTDSATEVYRELTDSGPASSFFAAAAIDGAIDGDSDRRNPFDRGYERPLELLDPTNAPLSDSPDPWTTFYNQFYFGRHPDGLLPDQSWRRIDSDWLGAAAEFALQLDSATNNTSLVLAIELIDSGKILLFAADAQVGNWLSWQNLSWKISETETVSGPELLERVVFYKVGHHGSHNATLKAKGLELMRTDDFVAFIPVNHEMAIKKRWGNMPLPGLVDALKQRSGGCVVRIDEDFAPDPSATKAIAFAKNLLTNKLFYEWTMPIA